MLILTALVIIIVLVSLFGLIALAQIIGSAKMGGDTDGIIGGIAVLCVCAALGLWGTSTAIDMWKSLREDSIESVTKSADNMISRERALEMLSEVGQTYKKTYERAMNRYDSALSHNDTTIATLLHTNDSLRAACKEDTTSGK